MGPAKGGQEAAMHYSFPLGLDPVQQREPPPSFKEYFVLYFNSGVWFCFLQATLEADFWQQYMPVVSSPS